MFTLEGASGKWLASQRVAVDGPEVQLAVDDAGAAFDVSLRELLRATQAGFDDDWQHFLALGRLARWRRIFEPAPDADATADLIGQLVAESRRLESLVDDLRAQSLLAFQGIAKGLVVDVTPVGDLLLQSLSEIRGEDVVVQVATARVRETTTRWLTASGEDTPVAVVGAKTDHTFEQAYVVGQPSRFHDRVVTAPVARSLAFVLPNWVKLRHLPVGEFSHLAQGGIRPKTRVAGGEPRDEETPGPNPVPDPEDQLWPAIQWGRHQTEGPERPPEADETLARRYLLAGSLAIFLEEDGEVVRRFYPDNPPGERVDLGDVTTLTAGTYVVLRTDSGEPESLYSEAVESLGARGLAAVGSQQTWKSRLVDQLTQRGYGTVQAELRRLGVKHAQQCRSWTHEDVTRPRRVEDFVKLLDWLGLPREPHLGWATELVRARMRAGQRIRRELEAGLASADLAELRETGHMTLGFHVLGRTMFVARVVAVAPGLEIVPRREVRVAFPDRSTQWLE